MVFNKNFDLLTEIIYDCDNVDDFYRVTYFELFLECVDCSICHSIEGIVEKRSHWDVLKKVLGPLILD